MDKQQTTRKVSYKGIMVPARELEIGKGKVKLVPVKTDKYTLYGIPMPNKLELTNELIEAATGIIGVNKTDVNKKGSILIRYIRKGQDGYVLGSSVADEDTVEYFVTKGEPYGVVVAFLYEGNMRIGWSKRLEGKKLEHDKEVQREPLSFTKKDAVKIAIIRGLVDSLTFRGSGIFTNRNDVIPKAIVKILPEFIDHAEKYFKQDVMNVYQYPYAIKSDVEMECPPLNKDVGTT